MDKAVGEQRVCLWAALTVAGADPGHFDLTSAQHVPCGPSWAVRQEHLPASTCACTVLLGLIAVGDTRESLWFRSPIGTLCAT